MLESPAGWGTNCRLYISNGNDAYNQPSGRGGRHSELRKTRTFSLFRSVSKIRPGSGNSCGGRGVPICTLLAYGVPALPMFGSEMLLPEPSAVRHEYCWPTKVLGGCGRSLYTICGNGQQPRRERLSWVDVRSSTVALVRVVVIELEGRRESSVRACSSY